MCAKAGQCGCIVKVPLTQKTPHADLRRMLRPLNTLATWLLGIAGALNVLHVFGYNVQPLLAAGGVSGIALGFGAQKITQNLLSGITMVRTGVPHPISVRHVLVGSCVTETEPRGHCLTLT